MKTEAASGGIGNMKKGGRSKPQRKRKARQKEISLNRLKAELKKRILVWDEDGAFPWKDVESSRKDSELQASHPRKEARSLYGSPQIRCPKCGARASNLSWFYFRSPAWTWRSLCGRAGWLAVCDRCHRQVKFFCHAVN